MKLEIRNGKILIDGYVNAVERFSRPLRDTRGMFIEKIMPNVFKRAIERNPNILVLLNHNYNQELANTQNGSARIFEDNIGLRAIVEIEDHELIEKAKSGKLRGWSFGFNCNKEERILNKEGLEERIVRDLDLIEVSIIDDRKTPAYVGTSIELRDNSETLIEYRGGDFTENNFKVEDNSKVDEEPPNINNKPEQQNVNKVVKQDYSDFERRLTKIKEEI